MTPELLRQAVGCSSELAARYAAALTAVCRTFTIDTPARLAMFLAQIGHESGSLRFVREIWGPTAAQARYEGRSDLGNTEPGDGKRFLGRGLIQLTGRANAREATCRLRQWLLDVPNFEAEPERLEEPYWACASAAWFWESRGCNALADAGDLEAVTRKINGGMNGFNDRKNRWERAKQVLTAVASTPEPAPHPPKEPAMPTSVIPAIISALLPGILEHVPKLAEFFKGEDPESKHHAKAAQLVFDVAKTALGATNEQEVVERLQQDPTAVAVVQKAIEDSWFQITESGGSGIAGARAADLAFVQSRESVLRSPSFLIGLGLLPLVYMIVGAVVGVFGQPFSEDVRAAIANGIVGLVLGGLIGYYYGQTTTRNRTPA